MKKIKINEQQLKLIIEGNNNTEAPTFDNKFPEFNNSETSTTANVTKADGDITMGKPNTTDDFANTQVSQNYWYQGVRGRRM